MHDKKHKQSKDNDKMGKPRILISSQQKFIQLVIKIINYNSTLDRLFFAKFAETRELLPSVLTRTQRNPALLYTAEDTEKSICQNLVHTYSGEHSVQKGKYVI